MFHLGYQNNQIVLYRQLPETELLPQKRYFIGIRAKSGVYGRFAVRNLQQLELPQGLEVIPVFANLVQIQKVLSSLAYKVNGVVFFDNAGNYTADYPLTLHGSLFRKLVDPIVAQAASTQYKKPGYVAIFTHVYNEGKMLELWYDHYRQLVPDESLYVVDDGSDDGSLGLLPNSVNKLLIPRGELDHYNMANYCGYFARFLNQRYEWVISTDADELLFFPKSLEESLRDLPVGIDVFKPEYAIAPIHQIDLEPAFNWRSNPESWATRRTVVNEIEMFLKPLITRSSVTWGPGQHYCQEEVTTLDGLVLLHAKHVDFNRLRASTTNWKSMDQTTNDKNFFTRITELAECESVEKYIRKLLSEYSLREKAMLPNVLASRIFGSGKMS